MGVATRPEVMRWWRFLRVELSIRARQRTAADESFLTIHEPSLLAQALASSERQSSRATRRALAGLFRPCFAGESQPVFCRAACCCVGEKTTKCRAGVRRHVARERLARTRRSGYSPSRLSEPEATAAVRRALDRKWRRPS